MCISNLIFKGARKGVSFDGEQEINMRYSMNGFTEKGSAKLQTIEVNIKSLTLLLALHDNV